MKKHLFLAGILLPMLGYSQRPDSTINSKAVTTAPPLGGINVTNMVAPIKANGNTITLQQPVVDAGIPIYKNFTSPHSIFIKTGIRYQGLFLLGKTNIGSSNFQSLTVPLLLNYGLNSSMNLTFIASATIASDFKRDVRASDIIYTAGVRMGFNQRGTFKYGITMIYMNDFTGRYLLPLPDIDWTISKRVNFSAILPARASLKYKFSEMQSLGLTAGFNNGIYALNDQTQRQYIQYQQFSGGLIYDLRIGRNWKLNLIAAHSFMQRLETFDVGEKVSLNNFKKLYDRPTNISYRQNSFVFQGGISYQF